VRIAVISGVITCFQTDLKKIVAYSRVTHITFMVAGIVSGRKIMIRSVILVSISHGWVSIGIFAFIGLLRHSFSSRLGMVVGIEGILH